jgi:Zn-dependent metalloprotease
LKQRCWIWICACAVLPAAAAAQPAAPPRRADPAALARLAADSGGTARVSPHRATGTARFIRLQPGSLPLSGASAEERARDFFQRHGGILGLRDARAELEPAGGGQDRFGFTHLGYRQVHRGVPVFAGTVRVHFDARGELTAVNGTFVPAIAVDIRPVWRAEEAAAVALAHVAGLRAAPPLAPLAVGGARLVVFRSGLARGTPGRDHLAHEVEVGNGRDVREFVYVDAHTGKVVERIGGVHEALARTIHEPDFNDVVVWTEGNALPYATGDPPNDAQVNALIEHAGDVFELYANLSGGSFLSWDGASGVMHSVWKAVFVPCPNASWNGTSTNFCDGTASDDVIAHEWTHAYTESTHGLIYQWQPGALNEAYSDIFGEAVDLIDGAGTDAPGTGRAVGDCSAFGGPPPPSLVVEAPPSLAGAYAVAGAGFNPPPPVSVTAGLELADDGNDEGGAGSVTDACQALVGFTAGRIAVVDRGSCNFASKVKRAQTAGAVGAVVVNDEEGVFTMGGSDPSIAIPAVMVSASDGAAIKAALGTGVQATIELAAATSNSLRWLMGEDAFAFGGAIRDLWNPACFGHPAAVSDPRYACGTGDGGGVHTNSGVPNHAFALLVDGGTFNGQSVAPLGLTKTVNLYWRAMTVYQVPATDFSDHADALAQSCEDLIGAALPDLVTGAPSGVALEAADCQAVAAAALALELHDAPACDFAPLLDPEPPPPSCGAVAFFDDFASDPSASWTRDNAGVFAEYTPRDWEWTSSLPPGGEGSALYAVSSVEIGNCIEGDDDQSGSMTLDSPPIALGGDATLVFDHYVATEPRYDGGNLKISVNDGPFQPIGPADFTFNAYNDTLVGAGDGNTNPLAGEPAFTGTDGGQVTGSWGQSQLGLAAHAGAGDTIRIRFDYGVDGCNGVDGWYVDNVLVCTAEDGAGSVPDGAAVAGSPLRLSRAGAGEITLSWSASCDAGDPDYAVYEGVLGSFTSHAPRTCSTAGGTSHTLLPAAGDAYYLVVPRNATAEGSYGGDSQGVARPPSLEACRPQLLAPCARGGVGP